MFMISVVNFIFAVMGMIFFGANDPDHFGSTSKALLTIWQIETLDAWEVKVGPSVCVHHRRSAPPSSKRGGVGAVVT